MVVPPVAATMAIDDAGMTLGNVVFTSVTRETNDWPTYQADAQRTGGTLSPAPADNTTIWKFTTGAPGNSSPVIVSGVVYYGSGDGYVYALNFSTGALLWKARTGGPVHSTGAISGGLLYVGSDDGCLHCYYISNGTELFNYSAGSPVRSPVLIAGTDVVFGTEAGVVFALGASGNHLFNYTLTSPVRAPPAYYQNRAYVVNGRNVSAINLTTGVRNWFFAVGPGNASGPCIGAGKLFLASEDGFLRAYDAPGGGSLWSNNTLAGGSQNSPTYYNGSVFIGSRGGRFYRINASNGWVEWNISAPGPVDTCAALSPNAVLFGTQTGLCAVSDAGEWIWNLTAGTGATSPVAISRSRAFAARADGSLVAVGHRPTALITQTGGSPSPQGRTLSFDGYSPDCIPAAYQWRSSLDGLLSTRSAFNLSTFSLGVHDIQFSVQDRNWSWSAPQNVTLEITPPDDWPSFRRDTSRRGATTGEAPLTNTIVWSTAVGGRAYSSPVVYQGMVFIGTRLGGALYALDVNNGSRKWWYSDSYGGIDSTPTCADGLVFLGDDAGNVIAFDADPGDGVDEGIIDVGGTERDVIWSYRVGSIQGSMTVVNGKLFVPSKGEARLYAFDEWLGIPLWNYSLPDPVNNSIWSSPAVDSGLVLFGASDHRLHALDIDDGTEVWNYTAKEEIRGAPCVYNGTVYFGSSDGKMYAVEVSNGSKKWEVPTGDEITSSPAVSNGKVLFGSDDNNFRAVDTDSGQQIWSFPAGGQIRSSPAVGGGLVFFAALDGKVYALNENTGKLAWSYDAGVQNLISSPALVNGRVFIGTETGQVIAFGKAPDLQVLSGEINFSASRPLVGEEIRITARVRNIGTLNATADARISDGLPGITLSTQRITVPAGGSVEIAGNWTVGPGIHTIVVNVTGTFPYEANVANNLGAKQYTPPPQAGWMMFKAGMDRTSFKENLSAPNTNNLSWSLELHAETFSSTVSMGSRVYQAAGPDVMAFDNRNGTLLWSYRSGGTIRSTPVVSNLVVFGSSDGIVRALNEWDGNLLWSYPTGGPVSSSPLMVSETVYIGSDDGYLYSLTYDGRLNWKAFLGGPVQSSPAYDPVSEMIVAGSHFSDGKGRITCLYLNGSEAWGMEVPLPVVSTPAIRDNVAYVGCDDGNVYALEVKPDGKDQGVPDTNASFDMYWSTNISLLVMGDNFRIRSSPALSNGMLLLGAGYTTLLSLRLSDGRVLWNRELGTASSEKYFQSSPAVADGLVYAGTDGVYALNTRNGALVWSYVPGEWVWASPAVSYEAGSQFRGVVYAVTESGRLCAFSSSIKIPPVAAISSPSHGNTYRAMENIQFNASASFDPDGAIALFNWSFGDGNSSTGETVFHRYNLSGEYNISLVVRDDGGLESRAYATIIVRENSAPSLRFPLLDPDTGGDVDTVFSFGIIYSDVDNDTPSFVRAHAGDQVINLLPAEALDLNFIDGKEYSCKTALLSGIFPVWFEASDGVLVNKTQAFVNLTVTNRSIFQHQNTIFVEIFYSGRGDVRFNSTIVAHDPPPGLLKVSSEFEISEHNIDRWWWATITIDYSTFNLAGVNRSSLRVYRWNATVRNWTVGENAAIDLDKNRTTVNVTSLGMFTVLAQPPPNHPPTAKLGRDITLLEGETATLNASASFDPDNDTVSYFWDFGDSGNKPPVPGGRVMDHKYSKPGRYIVTLTVSDGKLNATDTLEVTVKQKGGDQTVFIIVVIIVLVVGIILVLPRSDKERGLDDEQEDEDAPPTSKKARNDEKAKTEEE